MDYLFHISVLVFIYGILGLSLELVVGETGLVSVAHAAFFGVGAYAASLSMVDLHTNFFLATLFGMIAAGAVGVCVGFVFSRFRGDFYVLGTLGCTVIVFSILLNWQSLTNGP